MDHQYGILWIEDGARFDLPYLAAPVFMEGKYDLVVAEDVTSGVRRLQRSEFDVVIVDIRLPPGDDPGWCELYRKAGFDKVAARLGLHMLRALLKPLAVPVTLDPPVPWIDATKIGILTVERQQELQDDLAELQIKAFREKRAIIPETALLEIVEEVLQHQTQTDRTDQE